MQILGLLARLSSKFLHEKLLGGGLEKKQKKKQVVHTLQ